MLSFIFMIFLWIILLSILGIFLRFLENRSKKQVKNIDKSIYYRDIPCFGDINLAYWLLYYFSDFKKEDLNSGVIGAYLLEWYQRGYIDIIADKQKSNNYIVDLKDGNWGKSQIESKLYQFLRNVAGNNNLLEKNEIRNYCSVDGNKFELKTLFECMLKETQKELEEKSKISVIPSKNYIFFRTQPKIILSDELVEEYKNLIGLKNFLEDYSNMDEKTPIEVQIWEEYLIFANVLGIANKVKEQFTKIYPDFRGISNMFEVSLDGTLVGKLHLVYRSFLEIGLGMAVILGLIVFIFLMKR